MPARRTEWPRRPGGAGESPVNSREANEMDLEGVLIPVTWECSGDVMDVGLLTFDEGEYRIDSATATEHGLWACLREHVRITAVVNGARVILVTCVEVLESRDLGSSQHGEEGEPPSPTSNG